MFCLHRIIKGRLVILQIRTLHDLCFFVVDCGHIDLGFMVYLKQTITHNMTFLGIFYVSFSKKYYQHVRNAVLDVCAKPVPVWDKRREMKGLLRGEKLS